MYMFHRICWSRGMGILVVIDHQIFFCGTILPKMSQLLVQYAVAMMDSQHPQCIRIDNTHALSPAASAFSFYTASSDQP